MEVKIYDTTLRDGAQTEGISFSIEDKLKIAKKLDELGVHYIEGGWPGSNPKDIKFFQEIKNVRLQNAKITSFGSTRRAKVKVEDDENIMAILEVETSCVTIFGKSWDLHVKDVLKISLLENLEIIRDTITYLKKMGKEVIYDAEHFFDGYKSNPEYALTTLRAAEESGATVLVLCDSNGGTMPYEIQEIIEEVKQEVHLPLGIHAHNDSGMGVANSIMAVRSGCQHVQGTINGYGERCGNADLCSIIPNLKLKLGIDCVSGDQMKRLTETSRFIREVANMSPNHHSPYVGHSAFSHKGGVHIDAVRKNPRTYEHIEPSSVGNHRHIMVSELAGRKTILHKAEEYNIKVKEDKLPQILKQLKGLENEGYQFEDADASFELLIRKNLGIHKRFFDPKGYRVLVRMSKEGLTSEATVKLQVKGHEEFVVAEGDGPVNALDNALRKALAKTYPVLEKVHLTDYKVRVLDAKSGTAAKVRVLIESSGENGSWGTVGVSENIIEASWHALVDSIEYILLKNEEAAVNKR
ncbi:MAG: citramalate synthase [bacterium]|nr:citramalate synthase [bacterium]